MQLNELGEFGLIGLIRKKFASVSAAGYEGIGDDCAVMPCGDGTSLVVTTDMLIEEVHFRLCTTDPYRLGRKSLAVNLSDIAAMGAAPAASFLSIALPPDTAVEWVERFLDGYCSLSSEFFVPLLGEDYRLLLTADPDEADALIERYAQRFGTPLYEIGRIIESSGIRWKENGRAIRPRWQGFRHF